MKTIIVITAYRDHGHALARGMTAKAGMAELLGKVTGCSRGKGGSMHFFDAEKGFLGGHAIVGSHIAAGRRCRPSRSKYRGEDRVCICYFGDGAVNQGSVHEALNMAASWKLPVIYIVENNLYAMGTSLERSTAVLDLTASLRHRLRHSRFHHQRQRHRADGQDHARGDQPRRAGEGPTFIEAQTYRYKGHSISDPGKYRLRTSWRAPSRTTRSSCTRTSSSNAGGSTKRPSRSCAKRSRPRSKRPSSSPSRASPPPLDQLYEDITVAPFIPQE